MSADQDQQEQAIPDDGFQVSRPIEEGTVSLAEADPSLHKSFQDVIGALREGMIPPEMQHSLFEEMSPTLQREIVARVSGLDASILTQIKHNASLIDGILKRTFNSDGTLKSGAEDIGMEPKAAVNASLKLTQMMIRELPKIYNMDRIARLEESILAVMSEHLDREQQAALLRELDRRQAAQ